jgi:hypothetical protein
MHVIWLSANKGEGNYKELGERFYGEQNLDNIFLDDNVDE